MVQLPRGCHPRARGDPGLFNWENLYNKASYTSAYWKLISHNEIGHIKIEHNIRLPSGTTLDPRVREDDKRLGMEIQKASF